MGNIHNELRASIHLTERRSISIKSQKLPN